MRRTAALMTIAIAFFGTTNAGCSFVYTKGPRPEVQPPPPCTTSNEAPIADTVLAVASAGAVIAGSIVFANANRCSGFLCGVGNELTGGGAIIIGGIGTLVFAPSAVTGYNRTASCRAWLDGDPEYAPPRRPGARHEQTSSSLLKAAQGCSSDGDAPLLCSSHAMWGTGL